LAAASSLEKWPRVRIALHTKVEVGETVPLAVDLK
jgi:hypothetical protein